jgi:hypothetical protein
MRFFNTAGPVKPDLHYCLPPLTRWHLPTVLQLIQQQKYFVLHAPRQTGKTSCLLALQDYLNARDDYHCIYVNVEVGQSAREHVTEAMRAIIAQALQKAEPVVGPLVPVDEIATELDRWGGHATFNRLLTLWSQRAARPLVLLLDEIDSLIGDTLISILRQLRTGYTDRPAAFPQSVVLCGVRDVRDYRIHASSEKAIITGGSAFNIKATSLRLGDFNRTEMETLYSQHTEATGQVFETAALERLWELTQGQPWLINALGQEVCFEMPAGQERTQPLSVALVDEAKENLILRREIHLDQLADKLREERVRRVIEPLLAGHELAEHFHPDDVNYLVDLGLIRRVVGSTLTVSNPIYREIIPRELGWTIQEGMAQETAWYINPDDRLNLPKLLVAFQDFFRQHSEHWVERFQYREAGPQLLMQAFLQRIVNGGGRIEREYGLGRLRTDLLVVWFHPAGTQRVVIELKLLHKSLEQTVAQGVQQTWEYLDRCGAEEGHLLIFDRTPGKAWEDKLFRRQETVRGQVIQVWGM